MEIQDKHKKSQMINSFVIAVLCTENLLFNILLITFNIEYGFFLLTGMAFLLSGISLCFCYQIESFKVKSIGFLLAVIMILYLLSFATKHNGDLSFAPLVGYCVFPAFCMMLDKDTKFVLECILVISLTSMPVISELFSYQYTNLQQIDMSRGYAVFVVVSAALIHFFRYRKNSCLLIKICYLYNLFLIYKLITVGNRGAVLSLAFLVFMLLMESAKDAGRAPGLKSVLIILLCLLTFAAVYFLRNMESVVMTLYDFASEHFEPVPSFIIKMHNLTVLKSDVSNGRNPVYEFFFKAIAEHPILGYGVNMSKAVSKGAYPYPHNFAVQMIFEGGILFAAYPLFISARMILQTIIKKWKNRKTEIFAVFLLCNCVPKLLISGNIWNQPVFWMWIAFAATNPYQKKERYNEQPKT